MPRDHAPQQPEHEHPDHDRPVRGQRGHDQAHFDERARDWDDDTKVDRARVVAAAVRARVDVGPDTRVLEYGAGTGLTVEHLAPDGIGPTVLADPSAGMREVMGGKVADGRLPRDARVVDVDLSAGDTLDEEFDLVVTVMTLHHIPDVDVVLAAFRALLAPGGVLCVVDLVAEDGSFHQSLDDFHGHDGFDRADLAAVLAAAGFDPPTWEVVHHLPKDGREYPLFLATASAA